MTTRTSRKMILKLITNKTRMLMMKLKVMISKTTTVWTETKMTPLMRRKLQPSQLKPSFKRVRVSSTVTCTRLT